jgi:hypothetical protein
LENEYDSPNWRTVVEVIHGHTYFKGNIAPRDVSDLHSEALKFLSITASKVEKILDYKAI